MYNIPLVNDYILDQTKNQWDLTIVRFLQDKTAIEAGVWFNSSYSFVEKERANYKEMETKREKVFKQKNRKLPQCIRIWIFQLRYLRKGKKRKRKVSSCSINHKWWKNPEN